jgi:hypothetical protein
MISWSMPSLIQLKLAHEGANKASKQKFKIAQSHFPPSRKDQSSFSLSNLRISPLQPLDATYHCNEPDHNSGKGQIIYDSDICEICLPSPGKERGRVTVDQKRIEKYEAVNKKQHSCNDTGDKNQAAQKPEVAQSSSRTGFSSPAMIVSALSFFQAKELGSFLSLSPSV